MHAKETSSRKGIIGDGMKNVHYIKAQYLSQQLTKLMHKRLCIKLVNYEYKCTEVHGQQNIKIKARYLSAV